MLTLTKKPKPEFVCGWFHFRTRPCLIHNCPACRVTTHIELNGSGTLPFAKCGCGKQIVAPKNNTAIQAHLSAPRKYLDPEKDGVDALGVGEDGGVTLRQFQQAIQRGQMPRAYHFIPRRSAGDLIVHGVKRLFGFK